jgi:cytosine/adenosine deaminase-related metal-dependent hydrolase
MTTYDVIIQNGYVQERESVVDIAIEGSKIVSVESDISETATKIIDADENLVTPSFTDCHMHADRSFALCGGRHPVGNEYEPDSIGLRSSYANEKFDEHFNNISKEELTKNIIRDIQGTVTAGSGYVRTHLGLDHVSDPMMMEATLDARDAVQDIVDVQIVPFVVNSLFDEKVRDLFEECIEMGINQVNNEEILMGGIGTGSEEGKNIDRTIDEWFAFAKKYDLDLDVHIQDHGSLGAYTIEQLIQSTGVHDYEGRVTGSHCYGLAHLPDEWQNKILDRAAEVDLKLTTCYSSTPCSWPLRECLDKDIPVGHGTDNTHDYIMPYGISDSLTGLLIESVKLTDFEGYSEDIFWYQSNEGFQSLWELVTHKGASVLGIEDYGITEGTPADLVVLDEPSREWSITRQASGRYILKGGSIIAKDNTLLPEYNVLE